MKLYKFQNFNRFSLGHCLNMSPNLIRDIVETMKRSKLWFGENEVYWFFIL